MKPIRFLLSTLCLGLTVACTQINEPPEQEASGSFRMLIANEGQFTYGTASLTAITTDNVAINDLFQTKNSRPLGDVAQSITHYQNSFYVTLNNSRKIEVMSDSDFSSEATILLPDGMIPTYMAHLGGDSMAVSDKGASGQLVMVDTQLKNVRRTLNKVGTTNQMLLVKGKLFLAGVTLRVLSLGNFEKEKMRTVVDSNGASFGVVGDSKLVLDREGMIWALNSKRLFRIDPSSEKVIKEFPLNGISMGLWDGRLDIDRSGSRLYIAGAVNGKNGVLRMNITDESAPTALLFPFTGVRMQYNMAVSNEETILVCDVLFGSIARGLVHEYSTTGQKLHTFEAGIFPQYIYFPEP